jgi:hypothetical protein
MRVFCSIILLIIILSCGSRKKEVQKRVEIKTSQEVLFDKGVITSETNFNTRDITWEPIDPSQPFIIDGKEFINVRIKRKEDKSVNKVVEVKDFEIKTETKEKIKSEDLDLETSNSSVYFYIFLAIVAVALIYFDKRWLPYFLNPKK